MYEKRRLTLDSLQGEFIVGAGRMRFPIRLAKAWVGLSIVVLSFTHRERNLYRSIDTTVRGVGRVWVGLPCMGEVNVQTKRGAAIFGSDANSGRRICYVICDLMPLPPLPCSQLSKV